MTGNEIRQKYLEFFASKGHKVVGSDSLVPKDDPTVLFTTAGMQQFKPQFMGHLTGFKTATSSQKCLRTDDLPEVGVTDFHHTFFEMLGNFSFGDYFKKEAIHWAWEFLTEVLGIAKDKLCVSVNQDDDEAYQIWLNDIKMPQQKIYKLGDKSNFWPSDARKNGPNGPCGPCSEIFFDWGVNDCKNPDCNPDCNCGRYCEVWNLVFTQYNRQDGGKLEPLPAKNIDTGMGLERLTAVIQGKHNNYETDLFTPLTSAITVAVQKEGKELSLRETRVVADHLRAVTFGLNDGVVPSNEGRGYVMRRLIVDMTNIMLQAGIQRPVLYTLIATVVDGMKNAYPDLVKSQKDVTENVKRVEEAVIKLNKEKGPEFEKNLKSVEAKADAIGELMFRYRDTYGLPLSLIQARVKDQFGAALLAQADEICETRMNEQKERSRASSKMQGDVFLGGDLDVKGLPKTEFVGYEAPSAEVNILKIFVNGKSVDEAKDGDKAVVICDKTTFYPEQGGQVADLGMISTKEKALIVEDTQKQNDVILHSGTVQNGLKIGEAKTFIDGERRMAIMRNHTSTHLLQAALQSVLGEHVKQQGSSVDETRLRFDFTHPKAVKAQELKQIEDMVNTYIRRCDIVLKQDMTIEEAKKSGALAFFAEKYGESVRVVSVGDYSKEFCGGTHLNNSGQIGLFKIISESAVAQGIRRIEAVTGTVAIAYVHQVQEQLSQAAGVLKASPNDVVERLNAQTKRLKELQKEVGALNFNVIKASLEDILNEGQDVSGVMFIGHMFKNVDIETLRQVADLIKQKQGAVVSLLASQNGVDGVVILSSSDDVVSKGFQAGKVIQNLASLFEGSGGGRPNMAQAGCQDVKKLIAVFDQLKDSVKEQIGK